MFLFFIRRSLFSYRSLSPHWCSRVSKSDSSILALGDISVLTAINYPPSMLRRHDHRCWPSVQENWPAHSLKPFLEALAVSLKSCSALHSLQNIFFDVTMDSEPIPLTQSDGYCPAFSVWSLTSKAAWGHARRRSYNIRSSGSLQDKVVSPARRRYFISRYADCMYSVLTFFCLDLCTQITIHWIRKSCPLRLSRESLGVVEVVVGAKQLECPSQ